MLSTAFNWYKQYQLLIQLIIWGAMTFGCIALFSVGIDQNLSISLNMTVVIGLIIGGLLSLPVFFTLFHLFGGIGQLLRGDVPTVRTDWYTFPLRPLLKRFERLVEQQRPFVEQRQIRLQALRDQAAQEVRNRLARDLHDSIKQQIFSIQMGAAAAEARFSHDPVGAKQAIRDIRQSSHEALVEMSALLDELAPQAFETIGLSEAIRKQAEALGYRTGAEVVCTIDPLPAEEHFPEGAKEGIFRIVQEAFSNIARHARAKTVTLTLKTVQEQLYLAIEDDGQGFDRSSIKSNGMGLENIQKRIEMFGGSANLKSAPAAGTQISVWLPLVNLYMVDDVLSNEIRYPLTRQFGITLLGAVSMIALLRYPLYTAFPAQFLNDWLIPADQVSIPLVIFFLALASVVTIGIGVLAVWLYPKEARWQNGLAGGAHASLAGIIAWFGTVAPAAGIWGHQAIAQQGTRPALDEWHFLQLVLESVTMIGISIAVSFWVTLIACWGLGLLGGLVINRSPRSLVNSQQMNLSQLRLSFQTFVLVLLTMITSTVVLNLLTDSMFQALDEIQANSAYGVTFSPMVFHWSERLSQIILLIGSGLFVNIHLNRAIRSKQSEPLDLARRFGMWAAIGPLLTMFLLYYSIDLFGKFENQILFATLSILAAGFGWQTW
ncbi:MAG: sensor histidine kinase, partial [Chloroflexota bacterium]